MIIGSHNQHSTFIDENSKGTVIIYAPFHSSEQIVLVVPPMIENQQNLSLFHHVWIHLKILYRGNVLRMQFVKQLI